MSRVHDALRRAGGAPPQDAPAVPSPAAIADGGVRAPDIPVRPPQDRRHVYGAAAASASPLAGLLERVQEIQWNPNIESHIIDADRPGEAPTEEFRTLRTR